VTAHLPRRAALAALVLAVAPALAGAATPAARAGASAPAAGHALSVALVDMGFQPATLAVRPGDRITWVNKDLVPHTVTARDGRFDSKDIPAGGSYTWVVTGSGPVEYACRYHPSMVATLTPAPKESHR
jgi:plastocyanin